MKSRHLLIFVFGLLMFSASYVKTYADEKGENLVPGVVSSTWQEQTGLSVTIYNVNLGLVKDEREIKLKEGSSQLRFMDVAAKIIPSSVHIRSLADPQSLQVLEQSYEYDLLSPEKLLDKYVGREIKLYTKNPYTEREEVVKATLLSNHGGPIYKIGEEITFGHPGRIIFPEVSQNLIAEPTLIWTLDNTLGEVQKIEASYLTNDINWQTDYILTLNREDNQADLSSWVTIDNKSGAAYEKANLKLVAGDVQRVEKPQDVRTLGEFRAERAAAPQFKEEGFFEYHIYTLDRTTSIANNQIKQIKLVRAESIPVKKELLFQGSRFYYYNRYGEPTLNRKVGIYVEMENKEGNNLGIPLPRGTVRVYKNDSDGSLQFIGEDTIDHTPKDEKIRIRVGNAADVAGSRKQMSWEKIAYDSYEASFEISLRNHKKEDVVVKAIEPIPGDWQILSSSHEYKKTEASIAEFNILVPKDGEVKVNYRVRMRF